MKTEFKIFLTFFILYSFFIHGIWWNDNSRLDLTKAILEEERFEIDSYYNNTGDRSYFNGHYYSDKAPGLSFLTAPIYLLWKSIYFNFLPVSVLENPSLNNQIPYKYNSGIVIANTYPGFFYISTLSLSIIFTSVILSSLTVILVYKITGYFTKKIKYKLLIVIIYGLGTLVFQYSIVFYNHIAETFFIFFPFYLLLRLKNEKTNNQKLLILAGILSGFSIVIAYTAVPIVLILLIYLTYFSRNLRNFLLFLIGISIGVFSLFYYNYSIFGTPFDVTQLHMDPDIWANLQDKTGFTPFPKIFIIYRLLFDPYRGFLFYHPIMIFSLIGLIYMYKKYKAESLLIFSIFAVLLIMNSMWWAWEGGTSFGSRHLLLTIPFLMIPLTISLGRVNRRVFYVLLIISILVNVIGLQTWEWMIGRPFTIEIAPEFQKKVNSFEILANPLKDYYLPLFFKNGPRARIVENLIEGNINIEIRDGYKEYVKFPLLSLIPLIIIVFSIWRKELIK